MVNWIQDSAESIEISDDESIKSLESYHDNDSLQNSVNELQVDSDSNKFRTLKKKRSQDSSQAIDHGYEKMLQPNRETMTSKVHSTPIKTQAESPVIALIRTFSEESKD